jgi:hypothetical protein
VAVVVVRHRECHGVPHGKSFARPHAAEHVNSAQHFPAADLQQWDIEAKSPDDFVLDQVGIDGRVIAACIQQIADSRTQPPEAVEDVLSQLERDGLVESVAARRRTDHRGPAGFEVVDPQ